MEHIKGIDNLEGKEREQFWRNVFIDFQELATIIRQEELREQLELKDQMAVLKCEICQQWEKHLNEWPHNRMT